ncbi:MAG: DUF2291 domain-containing protein [Prolixibacteraceae bacterium]
MNKILKYILGILAVLVVIYLSLDIQNLEKHRAASAPSSFNVAIYTDNFFYDSLPVCISNATPLEYLLQLLNDHPESAFEKYGHQLGISKTHYFMVKGQGQIEKVEAEYIVLSLPNNQKVKVATDFIFGNAVRDGSGKVNINDFMNMTDFNNVSVAINKMIKEKVVSRLRNSAAVGVTLEFAGAFEINEEKIDLAKLLIIPVSVKLSDGQAE